MYLMMLRLIIKKFVYIMKNFPIKVQEDTIINGRKYER